MSSNTWSWRPVWSWQCLFHSSLPVIMLVNNVPGVWGKFPTAKSHAQQGYQEPYETFHNASVILFVFALLSHNSHQLITAYMAPLIWLQYVECFCSSKLVASPRFQEFRSYTSIDLPAYQQAFELVKRTVNWPALHSQISLKRDFCLITMPATSSLSSLVKDTAKELLEHPGLRGNELPWW